MDYLRQIIEALLFSAEKPVTAGKIKECIDTGESAPVAEIIEDLNTHYEETNRAFTIIQVAGGYQIVTHKEFEPFVKKLYVGSSRMRLSQAALEALSIIAYKQPISRPNIDAIRGVNSDAVLRTLLERDLIVVKGREDQPGRPLLYGTSDEFLRYFGLNTLDDLPKLKEIDQLTLQSEDIPEEHADTLRDEDKSFDHSANQ
ncbi:MAG TPA: SMC-Scp complex subunit ScpB [bacterium]|nr:SMC-Scp complex subunit ScpB [bacterium]